MARHDPELRRIVRLERLAAAALILLTAVVMYMVFGYKPF